ASGSGPLRSTPRAGSGRGAAQFVEHSLPGLGGIDAQFLESLRAEVPAWVTLRRPDQAEQQVLGADVAVAQGPGFPGGQLDRLLRLPGHRDPPGPLGRPGGPVERAGAEALLDPARDLVQVDADARQRLGVVTAWRPAQRCGAAQPALDGVGVDAQAGQGPGRDALAGRQRVQQVHRPDLVAALAGLGPGRDHGRPGLVSESLEHRWYPLGSAHAGAAGVLLVDGLPGHPEDLRDLLPGPAVFPCVVDLERLELLQQPAEGGDGPEPGARV